MCINIDWDFSKIWEGIGIRDTEIRFCFFYYHS